MSHHLDQRHTEGRSRATWTDQRIGRLETGAFVHIDVDAGGVRMHARDLIRTAESLASTPLVVDGCGSAAAEAAADRLDARVRGLLHEAVSGVTQIATGAVNAVESTLAADARVLAAAQAESTKIAAAFRFGDDE